LGFKPLKRQQPGQLPFFQLLITVFSPVFFLTIFPPFSQKKLKESSQTNAPVVRGANLPPHEPSVFNSCSTRIDLHQLIDQVVMGDRGRVRYTILRRVTLGMVIKTI